LNSSKSIGGTFSYYFTAATKQAVKDSQYHMGITADGIVGPTTWKYLAYYLAPALKWSVNELFRAVLQRY